MQLVNRGFTRSEKRRIAAMVFRQHLHRCADLAALAHLDPDDIEEGAAEVDERPVPVRSFPPAPLRSSRRLFISRSSRRRTAQTTITVG
jgi:hypothetical protein